MLVDLPRDLRDSLQRYSNSHSQSGLNEATAALSARYRTLDDAGGPIAHTDDDIAAYSIYRFPATYAAIVAAFSTQAEQRSEWRPTSMLDLGAGLGSGLWAAAHIWPEIEQMTAVDLEPAMIAAGQDLCRSARRLVLSDATWLRRDMSRWESPDRFDLVLLSYVLGELTDTDLEQIAERAWTSTDDTLVIVEPGTPNGSRRVKRARDFLFSRGAFSIAPCPHDPQCDAGDDWMHFSVRLPRSKAHRASKRAELGYEDEKFAYVVMGREPLPRTYSRILRHPQFRKGHIYLQLCTPEGVKNVVISKRDRELYARARRASWGDVFDMA